MHTKAYLPLAAAMALASMTATAGTIGYDEDADMGVNDSDEKTLLDFGAKRDDVPPDFAGKPDGVPPDFAGKPDDVPPDFAGKPDGVPPDFAGKPDDVPPDFAGKPDDVPPDFAGKPDLDEGGIDDGDNVPQVPVPAAAWLLGSGLIGLVGLARRKAGKSVG